VIGVLLVAALVVGSGVLTTGAQTSAERAASLDARLKCPGCQGLSVAESASASSLAVRREVLEARYGNSVLLTPPPGGLTDLLWLVPVGLGVGIVIGVVAVARRRTLPDASEATRD
jgi:cytochrome c-type biogenesis protein CcmH